MNNNIISEVNKIQTMMFGQKKLLNEQASFLSKVVDNAASWFDDLFKTGVVKNARTGAVTEYKVGGRSITKSIGDDIVNFLSKKTTSLSDDAQEELLKIFLKEAPNSTDEGIKSLYKTYSDDVYKNYVLDELKLANQSEDIFINGLKTAEQNGTPIKQQLKILFGDSIPEDDLVILERKIRNKIKNLTSEKMLDPMAYTGGKSVDEFLNDPLLSDTEKGILKSAIEKAKIPTKSLNEWANFAKKDVAAFKEEFLNMIFKSKEKITTEINNLSIAFRQVMDSPSFIEKSIEEQEKIISAYSAKLAAKLNALQSKSEYGTVVKLLDSGKYPPEMTNFIKSNMNEGTANLYIKRFWNLNSKDLSTMSDEWVNMIKEVGKDSADLFTAWFKSAKNSPGWKNKIVSAAKAYDPRTTLGTYFFTNQFLGVKRFTDFAIRQGLFKQQGFKSKFVKYINLLVISYAGYVVFAGVRGIISVVYETFKSGWNAFVDVLPGDYFDNYKFEYEAWKDKDLVEGVISIAKNSFLDQFIDVLTTDSEAKTSIKDLLLALIPTAGFTTYHNSLAAKIINSLPIGDVPSIDEIPLSIFRAISSSKQEEEAKQELEKATGKEIPEPSKEDNLKEIDEYKDSIFTQLTGINGYQIIYYRKKNRDVQPLTTQQKENLKNKIIYKGNVEKLSENWQNEFYIRFNGKDYRWLGNNKIDVNGEEKTIEDAFGLTLFESKTMDMNKKLIKETLGIKVNDPKTFSKKKQQIVITEEQFEKLISRLVKV
jgi:hypothetical protein